MFLLNPFVPNFHVLFFQYPTTLCIRIYNNEQTITSLSCSHTVRHRYIFSSSFALILSLSTSIHLSMLLLKSHWNLLSIYFRVAKGNLPCWDQYGIDLTHNFLTPLNSVADHSGTKWRQRTKLGTQIALFNTNCLRYSQISKSISFLVTNSQCAHTRSRQIGT